MSSFDIHPSADMGLPPELLDALQQAGGAPQGQGSPFYGAGSSGDDKDAMLGAALDALHQYASIEDDEKNVQTVLKCVSALQGIRAEEQGMADALMSGKSDARAIRRFAG